MSESASTGDEREQELARLRAEVEGLKSEVEQGGAARKRRRWGRGAGAVVLIVIAGLLMPSAVSAVWANRLISNTDRYVQTVSPLAEDPAMQAAITNRITTEIEKYVNVEDLATQALTALSDINGPLSSSKLTSTLKSQLPTLAGPIASGVNNFIHDEVAKLVASPQFDQAWDAANRVAHKQLVAVLTGKGSDTVSTANGAITINLAPFIATVKQQLVSSGFGLASNIPVVNASVVLFQSEELVKAQSAVSALNTFAWLLPLLVLLLLVGGILLAPSRRRGFVGAGTAVLLAMLVSLAALSVGRILYLHNIPTDVLPGGAAGNAFDIVTRFLKQGLRTLAALGAVVIVAAVLAGPSRGAVAVRGFWTGWLARANQGLRRIGLRTEPAAPWVESNALLLRIILVVAGVATLLLWSYPTPKVAFWLLVAVVFGLAVIDFLRAPVVEQPGSSPADQPLAA